MSVGLFDGDMSKYHQVPFNLELMKLSSFYKKKGEIVQLSPHFSPERYGKFFYRQDYYDGIYPEKMEARWDIECGFFDDIYTCKPIDSISISEGGYPINYNTRSIIVGRGYVSSDFNLTSQQIYINLFSVECESINVLVVVTELA